jgi:deoxyribodipyrimidine photo-lyase
MKIPNYTFPTDRTSIEARIDAIDPLSYGRDRNYLTGHVTMLSPYISRGFITIADIRLRVLARGFAPHQIGQFLKELAWREFFLRVWEWLGTDRMMRDIRFDQEDVLTHDMPTAFSGASTGIEAIDLGIESLYETWYMHNHLRMYTAGIACNMSGAHWRTPSQWMYYHLLDGDLASNTCSWQWNAGAFSSKKYIVIQTNINEYTGSTQRKTWLDRTYDDIWTTNVPDHMKVYTPLTLVTPLPEKSEISLDPTLPLIIYTDYSIRPDWMSDIGANRVLVLSPSHFSRFPVSEKVIQFILDLARDNIEGIQIYIGEIESLRDEFRKVSQKEIYLTDHILYSSITWVTKTPYPYMVPEVTQYCTSFFAYWKLAEKYVMKN